MYLFQRKERVYPCEGTIVIPVYFQIILRILKDFPRSITKTRSKERPEVRVLYLSWRQRSQRTIVSRLLKEFIVSVIITVISSLTYNA